MDLNQQEKDRFLRKDPNQNDGTKGAVYVALNPAPKRGDDALRKVGRPKGSEEDDGAPNVLTGTVIVSCFIQTSALPYRIEMQGNDLTFFDNTYIQGASSPPFGGDTSRLIFTKASGKQGEVVSEGFIWEKRGSATNQYDNVLSLYAMPPKPGADALNYMFNGFEGSGTQFNTNAIQFIVNRDSRIGDSRAGNGLFAVGGALDGDDIYLPSFGVVWNSIVGVAGDGYTVFLSGRGTGYILTQGDIKPVVTGTDDLGSPTEQWANVYAQNLVVSGRSWTTGVGSPEGVVTAPIGSLYSNTSGGASTTLYVKTSGAGNTGWTAK